MTEFSRRNFLKGLGLGTVAAFSLPKKLDVVAATLSDLEQPPLSAGYACIKMPHEFSLYRISMENPFPEPVSFRIFLNYMKDRSMEAGRLDAPQDKSVYEMPGAIWIPKDHKLELWVIRDEGRLPITEEVSFSIEGVRSCSPPGLGIFHIWIPINNVRIDRAKAIQLGLADRWEPEVEETDVTQDLIIN